MQEMDYKKTTIKVLEFVNKAKDRKRGTAITLVQKIPLDAQTKNDFELRHDTRLKDTMIYLDPDDCYHTDNFLLAYAIANKIHIKKSKYNPGSTETQQILEHELTHVQQYSENRTNESVDELELEAYLNEAKQSRNGEGLKIIEYLPGKYCECTPKEYQAFLHSVAEAFEQKVESRLRSLDDEEQYKLLVELERWSESCISNEFFDLDRWW
nr:MAG TPA: protein of unknown function (DUF4157) [Caudoviricetes sp.]